jgi:hypothetical protein
MKKHSRFEIVLEQGQAKTPFYELPESERKEIAHRIFLEVTELYAKFDLKPVTGEIPGKGIDQQ